MATVKVASLVIRTLAKPIATQLKEQAKNHGRFRDFCINIAQKLHRTEVNMRINLLGEKQRSAKIRPLSDAKAIDNGANFISEAFLFLVATGLIVAETVRGRMATANRRDTVDDKLEELTNRIEVLNKQHDDEVLELRQQVQEQTQSLLKLSHVTEKFVDLKWNKAKARMDQKVSSMLNENDNNSNNSNNSVTISSSS